MRIVHLKGAMCSGKTWCYTDKYFQGRPVAAWDVHEFYVRTECYHEDQSMNWERWKEIAPTIPTAINEFIEHCRRQHTEVAIIESGGSQHVNMALSKHPHTLIELTTPPDNIIKLRAEQSGKDLQRVLDFNRVYKQKYAGHPRDTVSSDEARLALKGMDDSIYVGIIGTAGRKEDKAKMSRKLYTRMFKAALDYLNRLGLTKKDIILVSGGAAWADHVAVSLFLNNSAYRLRIHMPSDFDMVNRKYVGGDSRTANYYHGEFSKVMGGSTLDGIGRAMEKGAEVTHSKTFQERNLKVAEDADLLIAFTWHNGDRPKPKSGTLHTWNACKGIKKHIPLTSLVGG